MKIPCQLCGDKLPRKRTILVLGLRLNGRIPRICQPCHDIPEPIHEAAFKATVPDWEWQGHLCAQAILASRRQTSSTPNQSH
jgi:hypothetical protein